MDGMHPRWSEALLWLLLLWTVAGLLGTAAAARQGDAARVRSGGRSLVLVWAAYLLLLVALARATPTRRLEPGAPRCFGDLCFSVERAETLTGFHARNAEPEHLLRVSLRISNTGSAATREPDLRVDLVDAAGHRFAAIPGLSGVRLDSALPAHTSVVSEPLFRVPAGTSGLALDLTHRLPTLARLRLDDPESFGHRPTLLVLPLPRP